MLFVSRALLILSAFVLVGPLLAWPRLLYAHEASLLEGAASIDAIQRSNRFVTARVGLAFGVLLTGSSRQAGIVVTAELLGQGIVDDLFQLGAPFGKLFSDGDRPTPSRASFSGPVHRDQCASSSYVDTRTRADGWDIQVRFLANWPTMPYHCFFANAGALRHDQEGLVPALARGHRRDREVELLPVLAAGTDGAGGIAHRAGDDRVRRRTRT